MATELRSSVIRPFTLPYSWTSIASVVPFTYRDGETMLKLMQRFQIYITETLGPDLERWINEEFDQIKKNIDLLAKDLDDKIISQQEAFERFKLEIAELVMTINNRTGAAEIQRYTLTGDLDYTIPASLPDNHPIHFVVTQDGFGGHRMKFPANFIGTVEWDLKPNSKTYFTIERVTGNGVGVPTDKWQIMQWGQRPATIDVRSAYRKSIKHNFPYRFPGWATGVAKWGSKIFPQGFAVDELSRQAFILYTDNETSQVVAVYNWDTGAFISVFALNSPLVSEGLEVIYRGGRRYLVNRQELSAFGEYDITTLPGNFSAILPARVIQVPGMGRTFCKTSDGWLVSYGSRRHNFMRLDNNYKPIQALQLPEGYVGETYGNNSNTENLPKMQGICEAWGSIIISMGGWTNFTGDVTPYMYTGTRVFSGGGSLLIDSLYDPAIGRDILAQQMTRPRIHENEAIRVVDGKLYSLNVAHAGNDFEAAISDSEGIFVLEEFSTSPGAIDLSPAAISSNVPDFRLIVTQPVNERKLINQLTGKGMTTLPEVFAYMWDTGQYVMQWYTSAVDMKDMRGQDLPTGVTVRLTMNHSENFTMELPGMGYTYRFYGNATEGWKQTWQSDGTETALDLKNGATSVYGASCYHRDGEVQLNGAVAVGAVTKDAWVVVANIPQGFRPRKYQYYPAYIPQSAVGVDCRVQTNGDVEMFIKGTSAGNVVLTGIRFLGAGM